MLKSELEVDFWWSVFAQEGAPSSSVEGAARRADKALVEVRRRFPGGDVAPELLLRDVNEAWAWWKAFRAADLAGYKLKDATAEADEVVAVVRKRLPGGALPKSPWAA